MLEGLEELVPVLALLDAVVDVGHMGQQSLLAVGAEGIGPEEVHVACVLELIFDSVSNSIQQYVLEVVAEEQRCQRRGAEGINLPHRINFAL